MMNVDTILHALNVCFVWDGWRGIAAVGTFAAVAVALNRDRVAEKQRRIREAHAIGAMIAEIEAIHHQILEYKKYRKNKLELKKFLKNVMIVRNIQSAKSFFSSIKLSDCSSVEVITTVSVLRGSIDRIDSVLDGAWRGIDVVDKDYVVPEDLDLDIFALSQCLSDLHKEQKIVSGKYFSVSTQSGHREHVKRIIHGSPRLRSLKSIPSLVVTIVTNRSVE